MLCCDNLSLSIKDKKFLKNIAFSITPGGILYICGKKKAGKSCLLQAMAGIQTSYDGKVYFNNNTIEKCPKPYANYIGHKLAIRQELTVLQNLSFWSELYQSTPMLYGAIEYWGLSDILNDKCSRLSGRTLQRVALARLLACNAKLWLLDEVERTLETDTLRLLHGMIAVRASNGGIVILTTTSVRPKIKSAQVLNLEDFR